MKEKMRRAACVTLQHFNESLERADQKILRTAAASSPLRSDDKKWLQDCGRALAASR
jgi:hypothetical protein